ncbi:hypothetical protein DV736_g1453, partial [Chaetothyriales sp. CBS 134916]
MRPASFPALLSTLYAFTNTTSKIISSRSAGLARPSANKVLHKSLPTLPFLGSLSFFSSAKPNMATSYPDNRSEQEWQAVLNKEQFRILRQKGTELAFSGEYDKHYPDTGVYTCAGCNAPLYKADHKFKSGCGWPAYFDSIPGAVTRHTDNSLGTTRTEIVCTNCGGHLGHVFKGEGFSTPTDERHCVNSISLKFSKDDPQTTTAKAGKGEAK